mgnify:CR=1 FL=1|tara:strand:- start:351 stop:557 length:207 start_codon:yes stop_codon:yes gene_type:complete
MSRLKKKYGNYPRKPMTDLDKYSDSRPYIPRMNKAVLKEQTILNEKGDTEIIGNAPNVNYLKKKYYGV